mgnify:CR=1 FL=1
MSKVKIMAHRGASYHAPENTAAAFKKAYDFNVDGIETDLQLTKDGEIVIHHNYYIDDTSDVLNDPITPVSVRKNSVGDSIGSVILKNTDTGFALSIAAASYK